MSTTDRLGQGFAEATARYRTSTPMTPLLILCVFVTMPCLVLATFLNDARPEWIDFVLAGVAGIPMFMVSIGYSVLFFTDREKLQSEAFRLRQQEVKTNQEKGESEEDKIKARVQPSDKEYKESTGNDGGGS